MNHPVHKLVCIAGAADRGVEGTLGRGVVESRNAGIPDLGVIGENACYQQLCAEQ